MTPCQAFSTDDSQANRAVAPVSISRASATVLEPISRGSSFHPVEIDHHVVRRSTSRDQILPAVAVKIRR